MTLLASGTSLLPPGGNPSPRDPPGETPRYDLALTELVNERGDPLADVGSQRGADVLEQVPGEPAGELP